MDNDFIFKRIFPTKQALDHLYGNSLNKPVKHPGAVGKNIGRSVDMKTTRLQKRLDKPMSSQNLSLVRRKK